MALSLIFLRLELSRLAAGALVAAGAAAPPCWYERISYLPNLALALAALELSNDAAARSSWDFVGTRRGALICNTTGTPPFACRHTLDTARDNIPCVHAPKEAAPRVVGVQAAGTAQQAGWRSPAPPTEESVVRLLTATKQSRCGRVWSQGALDAWGSCASPGTSRQARGDCEFTPALRHSERNGLTNAAYIDRPCSIRHREALVRDRHRGVLRPHACRGFHGSPVHSAQSACALQVHTNKPNVRITAHCEISTGHGRRARVTRRTSDKSAHSMGKTARP